MDDAALNKKVFHLWWHPHEFGLNSYENMRFLKRILRHYLKLKKEHGMLSLNMGELAQLLEESVAVKQTKVRRAV